MEPFCRTCFLKVLNPVSSIPLDPESYKHRLMFCVPEMDLRTFPVAKLCKDCIAALDITYKFKIKCREVENKINKQQLEVTERFTVKQEIGLDNIIHTFCRICVKDVIDHSYDLTERPFYESKLMTCVPEMDLQHASNINLCKYCHTVLDKIYTFKMKCLDVEKNIKVYLKSNDVVNLRDLSVWCNAFVKYEVGGLGDYALKQEEIDLDNGVEIMEDVKEQTINDESISLKIEELKACKSIKEIFKYQNSKCNNKISDNVERLLPNTTKNNSKHLKYDFSTEQKYNLQEHIHSRVGEKPFKCSLCTYSAEKKSKLKRHIRTHTGEKPFKCLLCEFSAALKTTIKSHILTHTGEKTFKCTLCEFSAAQKSSLKIHIRTHTGEKPFKCSLCEFSAAQKSSLKRHIFTHTGEKPFKCSLCEFSTALKETLKSHILTHTGEKPFKCLLCDFSTAQKMTLKSHILAHTGEKPFKCSLCEFSTAQKWSLKRHNFTHTGEKPFKCSLCEFSTARKSQLKIHIHKHTGNKRSFKC